MLVVCLVEENILAIAPLLFSRKLLQCPVLCNTMFATEVLPEVRSDLVAVAVKMNVRKGQRRALLLVERPKADDVLTRTARPVE